MTGIDFSVKDGSYGTGIYEVIAKREPFTESNLFYKTVHKLKTELSIITIKFSGFQIQLNHPEFTNDPILSYIAYYSIYEDDIPLIFEIDFKNSESKRFTYNELIRLRGAPRKVSQISSPIDITLEKLIELNYRQNNIVVFRTERTKSYDNVNVSHRDEPNGFKKYTHKHIKGIQKSYVLFDNNVLNVRENKLVTRKLKNVQNERFDEINVYYRTQYLKNPLLIELNKDGNKYYLTRKNNKDKSWTWQEIVGNLENELESIETLLNYSIIVLIHKKKNYIKDQIDNGSFSSDSIYENETITVSLDKTLRNYICFKHDLSIYSNDRNVVLEGFGNISLFVVSRLFICNSEIETYDKNKIEYLYYQKDLPLYVYFYSGDNFPLMVIYNNKYYTPESKNGYFNTWVNAGIENVKDTDSMIRHKLDAVNKKLNEITINNTTDYTMPIDNSPGFNSCFNITRITVRTSTFYIFNKYQHTPKNYFSFNNMIFVNKSHQNGIQEIITLGKSVSVYYFNGDRDKRYPLVLELETPGRSFFYYFLKGENLNLEKFETKGHKSIDRKELKNILDHQNFFFNKLITIKLENQKSYTCCEGESKLISKKINMNDNPPYEYCYIHTKGENQKDFPIIHVETGVIHDTLMKHKFKRYRHRMGQFEIENEKTTTFALHLEKSKMTIKGFRILGKSIKLQSINDLIDILEFSTNAIYVYFYDQDPRPLLMCVENKNYYPESIDLYFNEWFFLNNIKSGCKNPNYTKIVSKLKEVCYNLNPVNICEKKNYKIHHDFSQDIEIQVKHSILTCYNVFTHSPHKGFRLGEIIYKNKGQNHKLFQNYAEYEKDYIEKELVHIRVYYPICDSGSQYPLLIQLKFDDRSEAYYKLSKLEPHYEWEILDEAPSSTDNEILERLNIINSDIVIETCTSGDFTCNYNKQAEECQAVEDECGESTTTSGNEQESDSHDEEQRESELQIPKGDENSMKNNDQRTFMRVIESSQGNISDKPGERGNEESSPTNGHENLDSQHQVEGLEIKTASEATSQTNYVNNSTPDSISSEVTTLGSTDDALTNQRQQDESSGQKHTQETVSNSQNEETGDKGNYAVSGTVDLGEEQSNVERTVDKSREPKPQTQQNTFQEETVRTHGDISHNEKDESGNGHGNLQITQPKGTTGKNFDSILAGTEGKGVKHQNTSETDNEVQSKDDNYHHKQDSGENISSRTPVPEPNKGESSGLTEESGLQGRNNLLGDAGNQSSSTSFHLKGSETFTKNGEMDENGSTSESTTGVQKPSLLHKTSDIGDSDSGKPREKRELPVKPENVPPKSESPTDNKNSDNKCSQISYGIFGSALLGIPPYPLYRYFERMRVRDMRAVF